MTISINQFNQYVNIWIPPSNKWFFDKTFYYKTNLYTLTEILSRTLSDQMPSKVYCKHKIKCAGLALNNEKVNLHLLSNWVNGIVCLFMMCLYNDFTLATAVIVVGFDYRFSDWFNLCNLYIFYIICLTYAHCCVSDEMYNIVVIIFVLFCVLCVVNDLTNEQTKKQTQHSACFFEKTLFCCR